MSSKLITILEKSCEKHGAETPITLGHLLNILKLEQRLKIQQADEQEKYEMELLTEILFSECGDRE